MSQEQLHLHAPWDEVKEKIKEKNVHLTEEDLAYQPGQEHQLLERLSSKLGKSQEEVKDIIESISFNKGIAG